MNPEPFMADALQLQSFTGVTNDEGMALLEGVQVKTPGLPLGFYRVRIASRSGGSETIRGCEIADDVPSVNQLIFSM